MKGDAGVVRARFNVAPLAEGPSPAVPPFCIAHAPHNTKFILTGGGPFKSDALWKLDRHRAPLDLSATATCARAGGSVDDACTNALDRRSQRHQGRLHGQSPPARGHGLWPQNGDAAGLSAGHSVTSACVVCFANTGSLVH